VKALLIVRLGNGEILKYDADWEDTCVSVDEQVGEDLFFSDKYDMEYSPEMDVVLANNAEIKSRVHFECEAGEFYSTRPLII